MRVYYEVGFESFGVSRVALQLSKYLPSCIQTAGDDDSADMVVLHVIGRHDHNVKQARMLQEQGRQYAVIQYVLQSSRNPDPREWLDLWNGAKVVWSYYDLSQYVKNFYHAPLSADPEVFYPEPCQKKYLVGSNGNTYDAECIGELHQAIKEIGACAVHVGKLPRRKTPPHVDCLRNVSDDTLRGLYNACVHFSCLRRNDGFEMTAIEALLCGVRPIMFDTPNYRQWFDGLAEFIPETNPDETVVSLKRLFHRGASAVSPAEIEAVKKRFDWKTVITGFWERVYD